jgi:transposase-like protein
LSRCFWFNGSWIAVGHEHTRRQLQEPFFSPDIIAHAVWLYYRFPLSLQLVEEMLLERGIVVSYETIRRWGRKRERTMQGFRSPGSLQRFVAIFSALRNLFVPPRTKRSAFAVHLHRLRAMTEWKTVTGTLA